jgi:hypothetical protein
MAQKQTSRPARWRAAVEAAQKAISAIEDQKASLDQALEDLRGLQEEYGEWQSNLPENMESSATAEKLDAIAGLSLEVDLDDTPLDDIRSVIEEAEGTELPLGFGRD